MDKGILFTNGSVFVGGDFALLGEDAHIEPLISASRGEGIEGGKEIVMKPGDVAHIPAGMPHWVKLAPNTTCTYLVFKEKT